MCPIIETVTAVANVIKIVSEVGVVANGLYRVGEALNEGDLVAVAGNIATVAMGGGKLPAGGTVGTIVKASSEVSSAANCVFRVSSALNEGDLLKVVGDIAIPVARATLPDASGEIKYSMKLPDASGEPRYSMKLPNAMNLKLPEANSLSTNDIQQKRFSNLNEMKSGLDCTYKEIKENKPPNAPNLAKWFDNGGSISISDNGGKPVWTYIDSAGKSVPYIDGYPVFPPEAKHPVIQDIDIGSFSGDRNVDKQLYLQKLEAEYGLTEIPNGYALHHDSKNGIMQLVSSDYHKEFTHAGGHSLFKEGI